MNKSLSLVLALNVLSAMGYAQTNLDAEVDAELNQMYSAPASSAAKSDAVASAASAQAPVSSQTLTVVNPATGTAVASSATAAPIVQIQKQPTTVIEASPLTESRAEALRKARQDAEMSTEAKIVEKLEQSRLEDEKRRAQILFGDKLQSEAAKTEAPAAAPAAPVVAPQPQIIIVPQAAPVQPAAIEKKDEVAEQEVQAATKLESSIALDPIQPVMKKYFSGIIGVTEVNDADYVKGNYTMGFSFGTRYNDAYAVEGSFLYSNYEVENVNNIRWIDSLDLFDVNQYSGNVALKYFFLQGMVRPVLGGLAQYSYREFRWSDKNGVKPFNMSDSNSHAFDIGGIMGVEIQFSPTMTLGFDVRYIRNVAVNRNYSTSELRYLGGAAPTQQQISDWQYGFRTPIEELDHYLYGLSFQVTF